MSNRHPATDPVSDSTTTGETGDKVPARPLSDAARRALAEAAERRAAIDARQAQLQREPEHKGRGGLDPVRYDDWEIKGLTSDF